jgi:hypothetical protein
MLLAAVALATGVLAARAQDVDADGGEVTADAILADFLGDPLVPRLSDGSPKLTAEGADTSEYELPPEEANSAGGAVLGTGPGRVVMNASPLYVREFSAGSEVLVPPLEEPSVARLAGTAAQFIVRHYAAVLQRMGVKQLPAPVSQVLLDGNYHVWWVLPEVRPELRFTVDLRPWDGQLVRLRAIYTPGFWRGQETVSILDVAARLRSQLHLRPGEASSVTGGGWYSYKLDGNEEAYYAVDLAAGPQRALPFRGTRMVAAATGTPVGTGPMPVHIPRQFEDRDWEPGPGDRWPCWAGDGVGYISSRGPACAKVVYLPPQVMLSSRDGATRFLTLHTRRGAAFLDVQGSRAAMGFDDGTVGVLDLLVGHLASRTFGHWAVNGIALAPDGTRLAFSTELRGGDEDIFTVGVLANCQGIAEDVQRVRWDGLDEFPTWGPDGNRMAFSHWLPNSGGLVRGAVWRFDATPTSPQHIRPEVVLSGLGMIRRMSFFPDGRLLVWHDKGLDVVDAEAKTRTPLGLPELRDPELPADRPALKLRDPAVSPDGKKLAFSGYRDSGDPQNGTGWYIYTCNLDGSDVKRVTPLADDRVEPYVFPQTGKTAFDVAREMEEKAQKLVGGSD